MYTKAESIALYTTFAIGLVVVALNVFGVM